MRWPVWRVAVTERSMEPALRQGDWLLVWRGIGARGAATQRGQVAGAPGAGRRAIGVRPGSLVIARHPRDPGLLLVKRAAWREPGGWWLVADNPGAGAADSFRFGAVPPELIEGRVLLRYRRGRRPSRTP